MYGNNWNSGGGGNSRQVSYPVRFGYINKIGKWWPPNETAAEIGVPEYAQYHMYNYIALAFWTYNNGPLDIALIWADPMKYFGQDNPFGNSKEAVQKFLKDKYNKNGVKILISAFGATEMPTTANVDPNECANKLGGFVLENNLDGVDVDWEDNGAMEAGRGEEWLIAFTTRLRQILPNHIITHAPQAPYFCKERYKNGAYITVDSRVGNMIDFYNVQFYNQGNNGYDNYHKLFIESGPHFEGTSVSEIAKRGVPLHKIVVGKPATSADATNSGYMDPHALGQAALRAHQEGKWHAGIMMWQFFNDKGGQAMKSAAEPLKQAYDSSPH